MQVQHARMMAASLELGVNIVDVLRLFQAAAQQRVSSAGRRSLSLCAPRTMHERHAWVIALNCWSRHLENRWNNSELLCVLCLIVLWGFSLVTSYSGVIKMEQF